MFNKLSFTELATLYGAVADLEKHYGHEEVRSALIQMSDRLDQEKPRVEFKLDAGTVALIAANMEPEFEEGDTIRVVDQELDMDVEMEIGPGSTFEQLHLLPKERKKRRVKMTKQRVQAEGVARDHKQSLDHFLVDQYYIQDNDQYKIADMLGVNQRTVSEWISRIPQKTIRGMVGGRGE